jgi:predicted HAD superfamily Cof-like phosphohydrolase|tara:strand:+ start:967 stop:1398 length:432 start_codon:yes stop_codon:yes gene_type:complete
MLTPLLKKDLFWALLDSKLEMVKEFNRSFDIQNETKPSLLSKEKFQLKLNIMQEELDEYKEACENEDLVEVADAIVDMMYVLYGIIIQHGLSDVFYDMFQEVHKSNMSKLERGKPLRRSDGKILKGSEYFKPDLKNILDGERK